MIHLKRIEQENLHYKIVR